LEGYSLAQAGATCFPHPKEDVRHVAHWGISGLARRHFKGRAEGQRADLKPKGYEDNSMLVKRWATLTLGV